MEKDSKKEAFRKYLESSGVLDALTKVLVALYEQNDKPSSAIEFIQQKIGGPTVSEYEKLQAEMSDLQIKYNELLATHQETSKEVTIGPSGSKASTPDCVWVHTPSTNRLKKTYPTTAMAELSENFTELLNKMIAQQEARAARQETIVAQQAAFIKEINERLARLEKRKMEEPKKKEEDNVEVIWDKEDQTEYAKKKPSAVKVTTETLGIREELDKIKIALRKSQGVDDFMLTVGSLLNRPTVQLPLKFKIVDIERFDGTGDPKQHLRQYLSLVRMRGLNNEQIVYVFPLSLTGYASKWFHSLDTRKTESWKEIVEEFIK